MKFDEERLLMNSGMLFNTFICLTRGRDISLNDPHNGFEFNIYFTSHSLKAVYENKKQLEDKIC